MFSRILIPADGSSGTTAVAEMGVQLAAAHDATVHAIHLIDTDFNYLLREAGVETDAYDTRAEKAVAQVRDVAAKYGVPCKTTVRENKPARGIIEYADEIDADLIVIGTQGRTGVRRQLLGSVAERVLRLAPCPVLTVRIADVSTDTPPGT